MEFYVVVLWYPHQSLHVVPMRVPLYPFCLPQYIPNLENETTHATPAPMSLPPLPHLLIFVFANRYILYHHMQS